MAKGFFFDMNRCIGCCACQHACKDKFDLDVGEFGRRVARFEGGTYPAPYVWSLSLSCGHCDNPACLDVCPQAAISKDPVTGIVTVDSELCVGCGSCEEACPYGAPSIVASTDKMVKCNACVDEPIEGPLCVAACRTRALEFDDIDVLKAAHPGYVTTVQNYADPAMTLPNVIIKARPEAL